MNLSTNRSRLSIDCFRGSTRPDRQFAPHAAIRDTFQAPKVSGGEEGREKRREIEEGHEAGDILRVIIGADPDAHGRQPVPVSC